MEKLLYARTELVELLKGRLAERETKRQEEEAEIRSQNEEAITRLTTALENPQFAVWVRGALRDRGYDFATEAFTEQVGKDFPTLEAVKAEYDQDLKRMIRALERAQDDQIEVEIDDAIFLYI